MKRTPLEKPGNEVPFALWGDWELAFAAQFVTCSMAAAKNPANPTLPVVFMEWNRFVNYFFISRLPFMPCIIVKC